MKLQELNDKTICDNCDEYDYTFEIQTDTGIVAIRLCKKCLLQLLKLIIER